MNGLRHKVVFSRRLGAMVAVAENTAAHGKGARRAVACAVALTLLAVTMGLGWQSACAAELAATALPGGGVVATGSATISSNAATMGIVQSSDRASINWSSFNVGSVARVNIVQPNASSVLLNRVVGSDPSQIMGSITANGQVMLVNPNGVVFGKGGSVTATAFTASTLGISDADFQAGNYRFTRNGSTAGVVNQGTITTNGGYVALLGGSVSNEGKIVTKGGNVVMAGGESAIISIPVSSGGKVRLVMTAADINTAVANTPGGIVQTEGGQVLMQAASVGDVLAGMNNPATASPHTTPVSTPLATITQSGTIDTTGVQGGAVTLRADGGNITVDGKITANSTGTEGNTASLAGGNIIIGHALDDNGKAILAAKTDVSRSSLESKGGFVETSADTLQFGGAQVRAKDWLLDPDNVIIDAAAASTIGTALATGNVTVSTTTGSAYGTRTTGDGNITVSSAITKASGSADTTLTMTADNGIDVNANIKTSGTGTGKLNMSFTANGTSSTASKGLNVASGVTVDGNGGNVALTGTASGTTPGLSILGTVNGGTTGLTGTSNGSASGSIFGLLLGTLASVTATIGNIKMDSYGGGAIIQGKVETTTAGANIDITGTSGNITVGVTLANLGLKTNGGKTTVSGTSTLATCSGCHGVNVSGITTWTGDLALTGSSIIANGINLAASLTGTSGKLSLRGTNTGNSGYNPRAVRTTASIAATGDIEVAGFDNGASIQPTVEFNSSVVSGNGAITVNSTGTGVGTGLALIGAATMSAATAINITSDTFSVSGVGNTITAPGVNFATTTTGNKINVAGGNVTNATATNRVLGLSATALNAISTGTLNIGSSSAGLVTVSAATLSGTNAATAINITGGSDIALAGTLSTNAATTALTLNAGGAVTGAGNLAWGNTGGGTITVNAATNGTLSGAVSGAASLVKQGAGTTILTGTNSYSGTTTISAGTLQVGTGGATGTLGSGNVIDNASLVFNRTGTLTVAGDISGSGTVTQSGSGTITLTGNNTYTGTTTISGGTLQVGNGGTTGTLGSGGAVVLSNNATLSYQRSAPTGISNSISGSGNVLANVTGAVSGTNNALTVDNAINLTGGTVNLAADGNVQLNQSIATTNTGSSAVVLAAGQSTAAGTASGGNVSIASGKSITVGAGGRATIFTGSVAGSSGITALVGAGSGNFRYNSSKSTTNYNTGTAALGAGIYAIYRESPTITATLNNAGKTYDGLAWAGGNGVGAYSGGVNGDTNAQLQSSSSIGWSGDAQGAKNAGTYTISGTATSALGYTVVLNSGTLSVAKANLTKVTAAKTYDGLGTVTAAQMGSIVGVAGETFTASAGTATILGKNVATANNTVTDLSGLTLAGSNGGNVDNYNLATGLPTAGANNVVTINKASATVTANSATTTYNAATQTVSGFTVQGLAGSDTAANLSGITASGSGRNAGTYTSKASGSDSNYSLTFVDGSLVINKASATVTANSATTTYNAATQSVSGFTAQGLAGSDTAANLSGISASGSGRNAGTYTSKASGADSNYNLTFVDGSLVINKANATVTANSATTTYNAATQSVSGFTAQGLAGSDTAANLSGITASGSGRNAGTWASKASGSDSNYNLTFVDGNLVINKASATVTANSATTTYNAATQTVSGFGVQGLVGSDTVGNLSGITASGAGRNAGTWASKASGSDSNYNLTFVDGSLVINKASATVTANSATTTYNAATQTVSGFTAQGLAGSDTAANLSGISASGSGRNAGAYTSKASGTDSNYNLTFVDGSLVINKASATVTANSATTTYNAATQSVSGFTAQGLAGSDTVGNLSGVSTSGSGRNAGIYTSKASGTDSNYNLTFVDGSLVINKASATVTANSATTTYNAATQSVSGFTAQGLAGSDTTNDLSGVSASGAGRNAGAYTSKASGADSNYNLTFVDGSLVINKASATVTANSATTTYNAATQTVSGFTAQGLAGSDTAANLSGVAASGAGRNAGTWASKASGSDSNYNLTFVDGSLVINKASATVTANSATTTYNAATQSVSGFTAQGLAGSDTTNDLSGVSTSGSGRNAGTWASKASGSDSNYNLTFVDGNLVINKANATVTANSATTTYNAATQSVSGFTAQGLAGSDTAANLSGITASGSGRNAGTYTSKASGSDSNYSLTFVDGSLVINKASATVTANSATTTYNAATQTVNGFTAQGLAGSDTTNDLSGVSASGAGRNAGAYTSKASGADSNYNLTFVEGSLVINKASATVTANSATTTYNAATQTVSGFTAQGLAGSDTAVDLSGISASGAGRNAGTWASKASGSDSNYNLTFVDGSLVINKASATVTASSATTTYNAATQTVSGFGVQGLAGSDTAANLSGISASGSGRNAGVYTSKASGADSNYNLTFVDGSLVINKASATVTANSATTTYNAATQTVNGFTAQGLAGSDTAVDLSGVSASGAGRNAGAYTSKASGSDSNYNLTFMDGSLVINKASATVTANSATTTYNAATQSVSGFTAQGLAGSDTAANLGGISASGSGRNAGVYTSKASGADSNYNLTFVDGSLVINKANATVTANSTTTTYNAATQSVSGFGVQGLVGSDTVGNLSGITASGSGRNAGTWASKVSGSDSNYNLTFVDGSLVINKASATVTANSATTTYNAATQSVSGFTAQGLAGSDTAANLSGVSVSGSGRNAGVYTSKASGADSNYNLTFVDGSLVINKASATVTANSATTTYNAATQSVSGFTAQGLAGSDTVGNLSGVSTSGSGRNAGTYTSKASGSDSNYNLTFVDGSLVINKATLTVVPVVGDGVVTGTTISEGKPVVRGLLGPDKITKEPTQSYDSSARGADKMVTAFGLEVDDGNGGANYVVNYMSVSGGKQTTGQAVYLTLPTVQPESRVILRMLTPSLSRISDADVLPEIQEGAPWANASLPLSNERQNPPESAGN